MKKLKIIYLSLVLSFSATSLYGSSIDLTNLLIRRNQVVKLDLELFDYLYNQDSKDRLSLWLNHPLNNSYIVNCQQTLKGYFKSEKIVATLCYVLRSKKNNRRDLASKVLERYLLEKEMVLLEISTDPRYDKINPKYRSFASMLLKKFTLKNKRIIQSCFIDLFSFQMSDSFDKNNTFSFNPFSFQSKKISTCLEKNNLLIPKNFKKIKTYFFSFDQDFFPHHPGHAISETGWLEGNKVTYLTYNNTSKKHLDLIRQNNDLVSKLYPMNSEGSIESFISKDLSKVFSQSDFTNFDESDPTWNSKEHIDGDIFYHIKEAINGAKESIFLDVFFLGGNMGQAIAKKLVKKAQDGVKVLIIRDIENDFGLKKHMMPVFNYLTGYMLQKAKKGEKTNLLIAPSYILAHKSGLPRVLSRLLNDEIIDRIGLKKHLPLHPKATSDHSKVLVIDGKRSENNIIQKPIAFVGSKNWTDQSGALCWDEVAKIEGPAAAVILDDYYFDIFYAFQKNISLKNIKLIGKAQQIKSSSQNEIIAQLLKPFDLLDRDGKHNAKEKNKILVTKQINNTILRTGYNNFNSTRTNVIDEVIQSILIAQSKILIKDQYIFDRHVVSALIRAKKIKPSLDIRIIVGDFLPNYIYADILRDAKIPMRFKKFIKDSEIAQEFHMKTISIDSESVITGSANKDQTTMYGSFREQQVQIYDKKSTAIHDRTFESVWSDKTQVTPSFKEYSYDVPKELIALKTLKDQKGISLSPKEAMKAVRDLISIMYDGLAL